MFGLTINGPRRASSGIFAKLGEHHRALTQVERHLRTARELRLGRRVSQDHVLIDLRPHRADPLLAVIDDRRRRLVGQRHPFADNIPLPHAAFELQCVGECCRRMTMIVRGFAHGLDLSGSRGDRARPRTSEPLLLQDQFQFGATGQAARYAERQRRLDDGEQHARGREARLAAGLDRRGPCSMPAFQIATVERIDAASANGANDDPGIGVIRTQRRRFEIVIRARRLDLPEIDQRSDRAVE